MILDVLHEKSGGYMWADTVQFVPFLFFKTQYKMTHILWSIAWPQKLQSFFFSFVFCLVQPNQKIITLRFGHLMTFSVPVHQWQLMKLHMLELWLVMFLSIDKVAVLVNILGHDRDLIYRSSWSTGNVIKATIVYVG